MSLCSVRLSILCLAFLIASPCVAQFKSGSTGSDGALDYSSLPSGATVVFNPKTFNPPLNPAGDNIFNFTTINIPTGVTVVLSGSVFDTPVVWLATGAVTINGTLQVSGAGDRGTFVPVCSGRCPSVPGAGGYPGGVAATFQSTNMPAGPGFGPGGGAAATATNNGGHGSTGGKFTGNSFGIPLIGGSGGGGGTEVGGAVGGAILIATSGTMTFNGSILAKGGDAGAGGSGGAGGTIRLMANTLAGYGDLSVSGGNGWAAPDGIGGNGAIRIEAFSFPNGCCNAMPTATYGAPYNTFVTSAPAPSLSVVSVNGIAVAQPPTGAFQTPDVTINNAGPVTIQVQASQVPLGTIVNLQFYSQNGPDFSVSTGPLQGTVAQSTATAIAAFPAGFTTGFVVATFSQ